MKIALISDIHSNLEALTSALQDIDAQNVQQIYCLGDVVGYGPDPNACCELLQSRKIQTIQGNHDLAITLPCIPDGIMNSIAAQSLRWTKKVITKENSNWLASLPNTLHISEFDIALSHDNFINPGDGEYVYSEYEVFRSIEKQPATIGFIGHVHEPGIFYPKPSPSNNEFNIARCGKIEDLTVLTKLNPDLRYLVNVGSIGQPRDNNPESSYVIYDNSANTISVRRCKYSIALTQAKIISAYLPLKCATRLFTGD